MVYKNSVFFVCVCVCKKLEIKFAYLAFVLFLKLSVRILGSLDFELYCQWQVIVRSWWTSQTETSKKFQISIDDDDNNDNNNYCDNYHDRNDN